MPESIAPQPTVSEPKSRIHDAVNLVVFGPIGVALAVTEAVPGWVAEGRTRAVEQFRTAKAVGELVTDYGQQKLSQTLVGLGVLPGPPPVAPRPAAPASDFHIDATPPSANGHPVPAPDDLAIPGYDSLSASQVVSRLGGLAPAELEAVRAYEAASRGRRTILTKISQLQAGWT